MKSLLLGLLAAAVASPAHGDSACPGNQLIAVKKNHRNVQCRTAKRQWGGLEYACYIKTYA
jgi:hypothetical protein